MKTIEEYIQSFDGEIRTRLEMLNTLIKEAHYGITSKIGWSMPSYSLDGNYIAQFMAHKNHIGFYALPHAVDTFKKQLDILGLNATKGGFQIPNNKPLPLELIKEMVRYNIDAKVKMRTALVAGDTNKPVNKNVPRPEKELPGELRALLMQEGQLDNYYARPRYQRTDYISWIERAARAETREKRITQMVEELRAGDSYMGMGYKPKQK